MKQFNANLTQNGINSDEVGDVDLMQNGINSNEVGDVGITQNGINSDDVDEVGLMKNGFSVNGIDSIQKREFKPNDGVKIYLQSIFSLLIINLLFGIILAIFDSSSENTKNIILVLASVAFQVGYLTVYILYIKRNNTTPQIFVTKKIHPIFYLSAILVPIICFMFFYPISNYVHNLLTKIGFNHSDAVEKVLKSKSVLQIGLLVVATVIFAPICEELIYRSALISGISQKFSPTFKGDIACASLGGIMFSLMHMSPSQTVFQFFLGFSAVLVALSSRSVIPPMIIHFISNLTVVTTSLVTPLQAPFDLLESAISKSAFTEIFFSIVLAIVGVAALIGMAVLLKRYSPKLAVQKSAQDFAKNDNLGKNYQENRLFMLMIIAGLAICVIMWISAFSAGMIQ